MLSGHLSLLCQEKANKVGKPVEPVYIGIAATTEGVLMRRFEVVQFDGGNLQP